MITTGRKWYIEGPTQSNATQNWTAEIKTTTDSRLKR